MNKREVEAKSMTQSKVGRKKGKSAAAATKPDGNTVEPSTVTANNDFVRLPSISELAQIAAILASTAPKRTEFFPGPYARRAMQLWLSSVDVIFQQEIEGGIEKIKRYHSAVRGEYRFFKVDEQYPVALHDLMRRVFPGKSRTELASIAERYIYYRIVEDFRANNGQTRIPNNEIETRIKNWGPFGNAMLANDQAMRLSEWYNSQTSQQRRRAGNASVRVKKEALKDEGKEA